FIGLLPGMPMVPFFALGGALIMAARTTPPKDLARAPATGAAGAGDKKLGPGEKKEPTERERIEEMLPVELVELEVGYDLVSLVDSSQGGELIERVTAIRRNLAAEL